MSPRTVTGLYRMSRRLMLQTGQAIEELLRRDLGFILATALDAAAINGAGVKDPLGILNSGIEKATTETDFSDTTANLIGALELDDVMGTRAFLTSPKVAKSNRKVKDTQGHVISLAELYHAERVEFTTQCPDNIGAGSNKSALIFGQWSELVIGYFSAVDVLVNPYAESVSKSGGALLHAFLDADVAVRHTQAFAYAEI
jgi:HK97 family phage major capsid protein